MSINVSGCTDATPVVVTSDAHGFVTGQTVVLAGISTTTGVNGVWVITVLSSTTFSLNGSVAGGTGTGGTATLVGAPGFSGAVITDATNASPIVVTVSVAHTLTTGMQVEIASVGGNTAANGIWFVTKASSTTFSLDNSVGNSAYTSGGTVTFVDEGTIDDDKLTDDLILIKETASTTGTGTVTLTGAVAGYAPFASMKGDVAQIPYRIAAVDGSGVETGAFEIGFGAYDQAANTLTRDEIALTSLDVNDFFPDAFDFQAGAKHVSSSVTNASGTSSASSAVVSPDVAKPTLLDGALTLVSSVSGAWQVHGRIQCVSTVATTDAQRLGTGTAAIFVPKPIGYLAGVPGYSLGLFGTSPYVDLLSWLRTATGLPYYLQRHVTIPGPPYLSCALGNPSTHPFNVDETKLPSLTTTTKGIPADIFIWQPVGFPLLPWRAPEIFYLNWFSATARNNGTAGAGRVGHDLAIQDSQLSLVTGSTSWCSSHENTSDTHSPGRGRFLYLATVCGLDTDGTLTCQPRKRLIWNQYNRIAYSDVRDSALATFDPVLGMPNPLNWTGNTGGAWTRMDAARGQTDTIWNHWYVNGGTDATDSTADKALRYRNKAFWPSFRASVGAYGNAGISVQSDVAGSPIMVLGDQSVARYSGPGAGDRAYRYTELGGAGNPGCFIHPDATGTQGFRWMGATQKGSLGSIFYNSGAIIAVAIPGGIVFPSIDALGPFPEVAGQAASVAEGEC